jgi:hypothetical protein
MRHDARHEARQHPGMDSSDEITRHYRAILARIDRYPVTGPAGRARVLAKIEQNYLTELRHRTREVAGSDGGSDVGSTGKPSPTC